MWVPEQVRGFVEEKNNFICISTHIAGNHLPTDTQYANVTTISVQDEKRVVQ